jgi:TPR repeat protein
MNTVDNNMKSTSECSINDTNDNNEYVKKLEKMSAEENPKAMNDLGLYYKNIENDSKKSFDWTKRSSDLGDMNATCNLAIFYEKGQYIVEKNLHKAYKLFKMAADKGNPVALYNVGLCHHYGRGVLTDLKLAMEFYKKSSDLQYTKAMTNLAVCLHNDYSMENNQIEAVKLFKKAAELGDIISMNNLGICYVIGNCIQKNYHEAVKCFKIASDQKNINAIYNLAKCYENGYGVGKDIKEVIKLMFLASDLGHAGATNYLARCYEIGFGVDINFREAIKLYVKAFRMGLDIDYLRINKLLNEHKNDISGIEVMIFNKHNTDEDERKCAICFHSKVIQAICRCHCGFKIKICCGCFLKIHDNGKKCPFCRKEL